MTNAGYPATFIILPPYTTMLLTETLAKQIIDTFEQGNMVFICGNGGSATMANHFAAEFVGKLKKNRRALPAISLASNNAILTALANDFGYDVVFSRQLQALAKPGDLLIALSTSGKSANVKFAIEYAKPNQIQVIDFPRRGKDVTEIQEDQLVLMHDICEIVEDYFV